MFLANVELHLPVIAELLSAQLTLEVVDVCVKRQMFLQVFAVTEALATEVAAVRVNPRMHVLMTLQAAGKRERLSTDVTPEAAAALKRPTTS